MIIARKYEVNKINKMMNYFKKSDDSINNLLNILEENGKVILIGGAIRSALQERYNPRDIDIILKLNKNFNLDYILQRKKIKYKKNRFGGYKIFFNKIVFDIWKMEEHWAFKNCYYEEKIENIQKTTFLNYDSLVYDYSNNKLYKEYYEKCNENLVIDIIGNLDCIKENPSPDINIMRMLKIKSETNYKFSEISDSYIANYYKYCSNHDINLIDALEEAYKRHYEENITRELKKYIIEFFSKY
ncbi:hypothetical protein [Clostridium botulinum]|uniref:hypothetical protein n=1 Tax=Clostridium botulinum TaxID=1491 RepID=UPI00077444D1|nr:hypothetical protein [Clostridium botulinum]